MAHVYTTSMDTYVSLLVALFSLLCCTSPVLCCPRGCQCMRKNGEQMTICLKTDLEEIPMGIPVNTDQLHFRENKIGVLRQGAFDRLTTLTTLALTHCEIEVIEPNAFSGLSSLVYLDLQFNKIRELQPYTFSGLYVLKRLLLANNQLVTVNNFAFNGLNLTRIRLDNNPRLTEIEVKAFQGAKINELFVANSSLSARSLDSIRELTGTLRDLSWTHNRVPLEIPVDLFRGFQFQELNLGFNGITQTAFLEHVLADDLSLEGNPTGPIDFSHYPNLRNVRYLRLAQTGFNRVDGRYFSGMPHLEELHLSQNGIMSLPSTLELTFENLNRLGIDKNNIYCNCELLWFKRWLQSTRTFVLGARCTHPFHEDILFMDERVMNCTAPRISQISRSQNVSYASDVTLNCVASGDPAPRITWHSPNGELMIISPSVDRNQSRSIGHLVIRSAQHKDQGTYRCEASNIAGNVTASTELLVYRVTYDHQVSGIENSAPSFCGRSILLLIKCVLMNIVVSKLV